MCIQINSCIISSHILICIYSDGVFPPSYLNQGLTFSRIVPVYEVMSSRLPHSIIIVMNHHASLNHISDYIFY